MGNKTYTPTFAVIGSDARLKAAHEHLEMLGYTSDLAGYYVTQKAQLCATVANSTFVVLPLPLTRDLKTLNADKTKLDITLDELFEMMRPAQTVFVGMPPQSAVEKLNKLGISVVDYYKDETLLQQNAYFTAQGLLAIVLENIRESLDSIRVLVTGYGRVGSATARLLKNAGADVSVCVRRAEAYNAVQRDGFTPLFYGMAGECAGCFDVVINTVEATVLDETFLRTVTPDCLLLEAASAPYGFDMQAAQRLGRSVRICPALPGKYVPVSAGKAIANTVLRLIGEGG